MATMDGNWGDSDPYQEPAAAQAPAAQGPITGPQDPRLSDPTLASDPAVLAYLNGIYGSDQATAFNPTAGTPGWDPNQQDWLAGAAPAAGGGGGGYGGGGGGTGGGLGAGSLIAPFPNKYTPAGAAAPGGGLPMPTVAGSVGNIPGAPEFHQMPAFRAPTLEEAMAEPGYDFVLKQGNANLQNWAAARGTLNDSSTAKAMIDYGQGAATTQYGNVWNRARDAYQMNNQTQSMEPYQAAYQNWAGSVAAPTMAQYSTNAQNASHLNDVAWQDNWNSWLQNWNQFRDQRDSTYNKQMDTATR